MVEAEQRGYEAFFEAPIAELNPAVQLFQQLTIRKWEEYLATRNIVAGNPSLRSGKATAAGHAP